MARAKQQIIDNHDGTYKVLSSDGKKYYTVTSTSCNCTGFRFRRTCKHVQMVLEALGKKQKEVKFDKSEYDYLEFLEMFGSENYDKWLNEGVIMRKGAKVRVV